ncbi:MAG: hypothetical protein CK425_13070 [Parachlamydia sp.]|nr:MAG: hypothetical protein CK425_13070 [Parachlamydia sp.]
MQISRFILFISLFILACSFSLMSKDVEIEKGNVIYFFESGKMQCSSEINSEGHTFVLYQSLSKNTRVEFNSIKRNPKKEFVLTALMLVEAETELCAGWVNMQEVNIGIDPKPVEKVTLSGKIVYKNDLITVMNAV